MRSPKLIMLCLIALSALVAAGCGGGPKDPAAKLTAACGRQIAEIAEGKKESKIVTAKSSEDHEASEQLHECAGQAPVVAAAAPVTDTKAMDAAPTPAGGALPARFNTDAARALFVTSCGGCHMLSDAKSAGNVGPNLDKIDYDVARIEMQIKNGAGAMPAGLLTGDDATNVATYVASVSPAPGA
ncbi:MAG: cytochrome c [Thermoleophilia bacterium]|nr:cytochrome c [Thermoleophilia bacterium]